jgi:YesN/AraC family two-component response regulator
MSKNQPFLDETLKLSQLAEGIGVSSNELSQVINSRAGQGFHDFVNGYRAHKVRALLEDHSNSAKPILALSLEAGFGNSATFYKYFKKHFGVTPSKFRKTC